MFRILRQSFSTGIVTTSYPRSAPEISTRVRGAPEIDFANWKDARPAAQVCPTSAISFADDQSQRAATLDLGKCIFCGLCAESDPAIRMTNRCELAARKKEDLRFSAYYQLRADGTHEKFLGEGPSKPAVVTGHPASKPAATAPESIDVLGRQLKARVEKILGRSLHIREVDAGSCNGCEIEIVGLTSPIYDVERFGIHFAASPRHADMLLVTG